MPRPLPPSVCLAALLALAPAAAARPVATSLPLPPDPPATAPPPATPPGVPAPAPARPAQASDKGSNTGLPLPRYASLRADEVNLRSGPGMQYPIDWVYRRVGLPVEIEREFDVWRLIVDPYGTKGWVNAATLVGRRTVIVVGAEQTLRRRPSGAAGAVAMLMPGVIAALRRCEPATGWCRVDVRQHVGWLPQAQVWGVDAGESGFGK